METQHTPGPWYPIDYAGYWKIQPEPFYESSDLLDEENHPNAEANAKLSAAAPDLLKLLLELVYENNGEYFIYNVNVTNMVKPVLEKLT